MYNNQDYFNYLNDSNRQDYYNYVNNNYNQPLYTEDMNAKKLFDPYQGFIRGNLFPNLYNDYKIKAADITPLNDQAKLLTMVDALNFAAHDIALYLDIYPEDKDMLQKFNEYRKQANEATSRYEELYGPIKLSSDATNKYPWSWNASPWPWENKED